jgi:hypothetical protein
MTSSSCTARYRVAGTKRARSSGEFTPDDIQCERETAGTAREQLRSVLHSRAVYPLQIIELVVAELLPSAVVRHRNDSAEDELSDDEAG